MTFTYYREDKGYEFDYEPNDDELFNELAILLCDEYLHRYNEQAVYVIKQLLCDYDCFYDSASDYYKETLKNLFEEDAYDYEKRNYG